jgi:hypothetical protein
MLRVSKETYISSPKLVGAKEVTLPEVPLAAWPVEVLSSGPAPLNSLAQPEELMAVSKVTVTVVAPPMVWRP